VLRGFSQLPQFGTTEEALVFQKLKKSNPRSLNSMYKRAHTHSHRHTCTLAHTRAHTLSYMHTCTLTRTHSLSHAHTHTHTQTYARTRTHTHTRAHIHIHTRSLARAPFCCCCCCCYSAAVLIGRYARSVRESVIKVTIPLLPPPQTHNLTCT
jgi:hypothetical protein